MADAASGTPLPADINEVQGLLARGNYVAGRDLATAVYLALRMARPLLLEGEAGVGKTEIANVLARTLKRDLIRLQCYEGLDLASAAYEWNYPRQMVAIRVAEAEGNSADIGSSLYSREHLIARPLLRALEPHASGPPVLLIDELDRADEPFEAFLLELLADYQISIPELGTIKAESPPIIVITSNRTREVHDALRRRCLYHWLEYPDFATESRIVALKAPGVAELLREQLIAFVHQLREQDLFKRPGIAETIDWANALTQLDVVSLHADVVDDTLGLLLKYQDDIALIRGTEAARLVAEIQAAS
ncbi:MAG TPA: MoxR family ATPase [Woeseiaceae bacterium]